MEFRVETVYDQRAMTAMAKALRRTLRKDKSRRSHIFGILAGILGVVLVLGSEEFGMKQIITLLAVGAITGALICEDQINGYFARRRMLPGMETPVVTFREADYHSVTAIGESVFHYDTILRMVQLGHYLVFLFSTNHAQIYDLKSLTGGTPEELLAFLFQKTGKEPEII